MKEIPILFNGSMVRAILAGAKNQTRRTTGLKKINEDPDRYLFHKLEDGVAVFWDTRKGERVEVKLPYGSRGSNLWVREKHQAVHFSIDPETGYADEWHHAIPFPKGPTNFFPIVYAADWYKDSNPNFIGGPCDTAEERGFPWRPSIHMPRWASRINREITDYKVERLIEISETDALSEGIPLNDKSVGFKSAGFRFMELWESINGPGSWAANPWVFAVSFTGV